MEKSLISLGTLWGASPPFPRPVLAGGAAVKAAELLGKVAGVVEAAAGGDLGDAVGRAGQQGVGGLHDAVFEQVLHGGHVDGLAEAAQALPLADAGGPGDAGQGEGAVVVLLDKGEHPLDALLVLVGTGAAGRKVGRKAPAQGHAQRRQFGPHHELVARVLGGQGVAGVHQGLDGPGLGLPVKDIGPEGPAPRQGGDVLFGKDGVLAAGDEPGAEHRRPYLAAGGGAGAVQHPGVDGDAAALGQMVGGVGGLHRQLARQDVDGLELVVPVPGQRVVGVGGVALGASDLLNATAVADGNNITVITWKDANGNEIPAPSDVGTYNWELTVTKKIGGSQTYTYAGEFTANGSFTIEQRRITVSLKESVGFTYDGEAHVITKKDLTAKDADGNADEFIDLISDTITYLLNGTSCTDMTNAGGYTVVLEFVDSPNYELVNNVGTVYVKAKPITVKVDPASKVYDATNGINGNVGISFTAEGADASDFSVVYRSAGNVVGAITTPGIYTYTIVSKDPNYTVSGESTGNFNVQISKVTYTKDDVDYVTIAFGSPVAVNYYLNDTAVAQGSGYWNIVDANVQKLAGEDGGLVTNGIIRIEMSNNNGVVSTVPGGVTVTARIPAGVGSDFTLYRVTSSGGLEVVEDYTVANGVVTYTTDYISNLVFVGTAPVAGFPWWIIPIIAAALVLTLALAILIAVLVKLHRAPDPIPVEVTPIDSIMPEPPVPAPAAPVAPVIVEVPAADIAPTVYDAPAAVSKHKQPPIIGIR